MRWRRLRHHIAVTPFPAKVALAQTLTLFVILALMPFPMPRPQLALPAIWMGAFCFGFMVAALLPSRPAGRVHWLRAVVDEERQEIRWE